MLISELQRNEKNSTIFKKINDFYHLEDEYSYDKNYL